MDGQLPKLIKIDEWTSWNVVGGAPLINGLFRPEEEHGCSSENDVVPPMGRRHSKVGDIRFRDGPAVFNFQD